MVVKQKEDGARNEKNGAQKCRNALIGEEGHIPNQVHNLPELPLPNNGKETTSS